MSAARPRIAWGLAAAGVALAAGGAAFAIANRSIDSPPGLRPHLPADVLLATSLCVFLVVGALVATRRPGNPVGWLLLGEGLVWELGLFCAGYVGYAEFARPGSLPAPTAAAWVLLWIWAAGLAGLPLLLALFPDGLWPRRRWRVVGVGAVTSFALSGRRVGAAPGSAGGRRVVAEPARRRRRMARRRGGGRRRSRVWPLAAKLADLATRCFGSPWAYISQACATWPAFDHDRYAGPFDRKTSAPPLLVNARYDAFSSLARAREVEQRMPGARLLTVEGPGHTLEGTDSACADRAVERYLIAGELPAKGAVCEQDSAPF